MQRRGQFAALRGREAHAVCDISDGISVRVDLKFVQSLGREGVACGEIRIDLPASPGLGGGVTLADGCTFMKGIQIGEIQAGIPVGKPKIGTGVVVRHRSSPLQAGLPDAGSRYFAGSIPNFFMREISVVRFGSIRTAAPPLPPTRPFVTLRAWTIRLRSTAFSVPATRE